jgi:hypothetical protein
MHKSNHVIKRQQQRGISNQDIDLVLKSGKRIRQKDRKKGSALLICFSKKFKEQIRLKYSHSKNLENLYLIVKGGDIIITAGYRYKKIKGLVH